VEERHATRRHAERQREKERKLNGEREANGPGLAEADRLKTGRLAAEENGEEEAETDAGEEKHA
jgi:hypothetical protein